MTVSTPSVSVPEIVDLEIRLPQRLGELFDGVVGEPDFRAAVERGLREARKALGVGHGVVERRLVQRQNQGLHKVVREVDAGSLHILLQLVEDRDLLAGGEVSRLHAALIGGGDVGDENGDVTRRALSQQLEPPAGGVVRIGDVAGLHAGHVAGDELHAAFAARAVAVAGRVDGDVGCLGSLENGAAGRGGEMDLLRAVFELEGDFVHAVCIPFSQKCGNRRRQKGATRRSAAPCVVFLLYTINKSPAVVKSCGGDK